MVGDPNNLIAEKELKDYKVWCEEQMEIEECRQKIIDTQEKIKCGCVFWEPWECARIRNLPNDDYESCTCICHKNFE